MVLLLELLQTRNFEMKKYVEGTGEWQKVAELLENFLSLLYCVIGKIPVSLQFTMK